jgi:hypothetical protein
VDEPNLYIEPLSSLNAMVEWGPDQQLPCPCGRKSALASLMMQAIKMNGPGRLFDDPAVFVTCKCERKDRLTVYFGRGA